MLAHGQGSTVTCTFYGGIPPIARVEGLSESLMDLVFDCYGGTPTAAGQPVPQYNITLVANTNITGRLLTTNQFSEALLIADEPYSGFSHPTTPLLNCGNTGAPDSGSFGAGVCRIVSTGNPWETYNGTPNGWAFGVCDGVAPRPPANSYGCGRPNVFQAKMGTTTDPNQPNAITFFNVPLDPSYFGNSRRYRIVNLRADAAAIGTPSEPFHANAITASLFIEGAPLVTIPADPQVVGYVATGLGSGPDLCPGSVANRLRICELFETEWRPKNVSFYVGDHAGIPGNATLAQGQDFPTYNGGKHYPADVAQNVVGPPYTTETFFEWQNNTTNGPPAPNPPDGINPFKVTATGSPLNSVGSGGLNTGISNAGKADAGTRIAILFKGIPAGASVQVPDSLYLYNSASAYGGDPTVYSSGATGVMVRTSTDTAGAGTFAQATGIVTPIGNTVVYIYEILWADTYSVEFTEIPYTLLNAPPGTNLSVEAKLAPFYSGLPATTASSSLAVPRFSDGTCPTDNCTIVSPNFGDNYFADSTLQVSFSWKSQGPNLTGAQVTLRASGLPDIPGTQLTSTALNALTANFNLANAPGGARDVVISPQGSPPFTLARAFTVVDFACAYDSSGSAQQYIAPASGGSGSISVSVTSDTCTVVPQTSVDWITFPPLVKQMGIQQSQQPYIVAPNTGLGTRIATVRIGSLLAFISQYTTQNCAYTVSPVFPQAVPKEGGPFYFDVFTASDCGWTFNISSKPWITFAGSSSLAGNGTVEIDLAANQGGPRTVSLTIAGQTVRFVQLGRATGVGVFRSGSWTLDSNGSGTMDTGDSKFFLGFPGATQFVGDWNGDGRSKAGVYSNGYWFLDYDGNGVWDGGVNDKLVAWGWAGVTPIIGDWNGDGRTKIGVYSNGFWFLDYNGDYLWDGGVVDKQIGWGWAGVTPIVGDWNGDGKTKIGVYSNGFWFLDYDGNYVWDGGVVDKQVGWGWAGVTPIVGDWNGDGKTKIGVYSGGYWYLDYDGNYLWEYPAHDQVWALGWTGTTPIMGDWNGDGRTKAGAFINGFWYLDYNGNGVFDGSGTDRIYAFGLAGDIPVTGHW